MTAPPRPPPPRLLAISDRRSLPAGLEPTAWLRRLAEAGVDAVQVREKDLDDRALFDLVRTARSLLPPPIRLLVNGRADVAVAAGADGVHLPSAGLPVTAVRRRVDSLPRAPGRPFLVGVSTHEPREVAAARQDGADYVTFGPVYPTPSKAHYGEPPGLPGLERAVAAAAGLPVLALGGVTADRLARLAAAGAAGAAAIRAFQDPEGCRALVAAAEIFGA